MSLDLTSLKSNIYDVLASLVSDELPDDAKEEALATIEAVADGLSDAIDAFVKSGNYATSDEITS